MRRQITWTIALFTLAGSFAFAKVLIKGKGFKNAREKSVLIREGIEEMSAPSSHGEKIMQEMGIDPYKGTIDYVDFIKPEGIYARLNSPVHQFVKNEPTLFFPITAENYNQLPSVLKEKLGELDWTGAAYNEEYFKANIGGGIAIQYAVKDKMLVRDLYVTSADVMKRIYTAVPLTEVADKNPNLIRNLNANDPEIAKMVDAHPEQFIGGIKEAPVEFHKMSEIGFDVEQRVAIRPPWAAIGKVEDEQVKPAGKDAFLAILRNKDGSLKETYMVQMEDNGLPVDYVPVSQK